MTLSIAHVATIIAFALALDLAERIQFRGGLDGRLGGRRGVRLVGAALGEEGQPHGVILALRFVLEVAVRAFVAHVDPLDKRVVLHVRHLVRGRDALGLRVEGVL